MNTYTMQNWRDDRTFKAAIGQRVDEEVYQQFLNCVPPEYWKLGILQVGEPYGLVVINGKYFNTFTTFTGGEGCRTYSGHMPSLNCIDIPRRPMPTSNPMKIASLRRNSS